MHSKSRGSGKYRGYDCRAPLCTGRGRDASAEQLPCDGGGVDALGGKLEDELHNGSSLRVRLHSAIGAFAVAVGTDFALILAALHLAYLALLVLMDISRL